MELTLIRFTAANPDGVPGVLLEGANVLCLTLEEDWRDNQKSISCIPEGIYQCEKITRPSGMITYRVTGVPNRDNILIHPGNTEEDVEGCILVGKEFGKMKRMDEELKVEREKLAILRSNEAFKEFMAYLKGRPNFTLSVKWA